MQPCQPNEPHNVETQQDSTIDNYNKNIITQDQNNSINEVLTGDLYIVGKIWIDGLQKALIGPKLNVVHAAKPEEVPKKPPKMKYSDLPIYEGPFYEYNVFIEDKEKCPERNEKLLQNYLLPYVKTYRKIAYAQLCNIKCSVTTKYNETTAAINRAKNNFKATMRDPDNLSTRQGVVGLGTLTGYIIGGGGGLPRRIFYTSVGFFTTGSLCFPKATDEIFRSFAYVFGKAAITLYKFVSNTEVGIRERVPCKEDVPAPPPQRKDVQCPPKK
ncbi:uncharacterized protein LOC112054282 [Bicyclus anynana]|uniref:MICOS complex subunit n=1 Tax=Bicyclus anynana TaxID=110368 RepID=A0A6J1NPZ1_BICAN|nr:uncharacterized protein LOC112054282 [Bicyclus anynana]